MSDEEVLEGFFAKKDKTKKPKKKKKSKTSETVVKETDGQVTQVDEWKDFEEEKEKDYSNLKIADLQVGDENDKDEQEDQRNNDDDDGVNNEDEAGIWRTGNPQATANQPSQAAPPKDLPGAHNVVSGKYVPPSLKRATMAASGQPVPRRRQGAPPDIKSQAAFPSLSAASQETDSRMPSDFELVKRGTRTTEARVDDHPKLDLGNRYQGLRS